MPRNSSSKGSLVDPEHSRTPGSSSIQWHNYVVSIGDNAPHPNSPAASNSAHVESGSAAIDSLHVHVS